VLLESLVIHPIWDHGETKKESEGIQLRWKSKTLRCGSMPIFITIMTGESGSHEEMRSMAELGEHIEGWDSGGKWILRRHISRSIPVWPRPLAFYTQIQVQPEIFFIWIKLNDTQIVE
jgi:hypothetical protein